MEINELENILIDFKEKTEPYYNSLIILSNGVTIDISKIFRVDKGQRFVESKLGNSRFQWSIIINHNTTKDVPFTDVEVWYEQQETRDNNYELILKTLEENGRNIIKVVSKS
jgi:hypothetical protein